MRRLLLLVWLALALSPPASAGAQPRNVTAGQILVLGYHDVQDEAPDQTFVGVTTAKLIEQFEWLRANGYTVVSVSDMLAARSGAKSLPDKPVLITFDDGFDSFYTRAFPILKAFDYPAVFALVGDWMDVKPGGTVQFGDTPLPRERFVSWDQVREMARSGLVEIAAHSYAHHLGIRANPQGNAQPAIITRRFDEAAGRYEDDAAYARRIRGDLAAVAAAIERETGSRPRVMVWPYGAHNRRAITLSTEVGMPWTFTLDDGLAAPEQIAAVPRLLVANDPGLDSFAFEVFGRQEQGPVRVIHVDLDYVHDLDQAQQERNLGALVQRIRDFGVSTVYLQAFADPDASGLVREVYFPNRHLPVRADLFNRVAWQLRTRAQVEVFAWMPVLAFDFGAALPSVLAWSPDGSRKPDPNTYRRLSPFDPEARRRILELYEDLGKAAPIAGVLFHDDALLSDFEDAGDAALDAYEGAGLPRDIARLRDDAVTRARWTKFKADTLIAFTHELAERVREHRHPLKTARNLYARAVLEPESAEWFAQDLDSFLAAYDHTAIMAMPYMEEVPEGRADDWLRALVAIVAQRPDGLRRTVFELQSVDWRRTEGPDRRIPAAVLAGQMRLLARLGALNFGYYPDDFAAGHPDAAAVHPAISLKTHPFK